MKTKNQTIAQKLNAQKKQQQKELKSNTTILVNYAQGENSQEFAGLMKNKGLQNANELSKRKIKDILFTKENNVLDYTAHILQDGERVFFGFTTNAEKATKFHTNLKADENGGTDTTENALQAVKNLSVLDKKITLSFDLQKGFYYYDKEEDIEDYAERINGKLNKETRKTHKEIRRYYAQAVENCKTHVLCTAFYNWLGVQTLIDEEEAQNKLLAIESAQKAVQEAREKEENAQKALQLKLQDAQTKRKKKEENLEKLVNSTK
jgi:hypothetical protein